MLLAHQLLALGRSAIAFLLKVETGFNRAQRSRAAAIASTIKSMRRARVLLALS